jgi:DNA-binding XRE family transcriptional regulator
MNIDMQEFYQFHGISRSQFASMIGVSTTTLHHYEIGNKICETSKLRIEIGINVIEDLKIIYPDQHTKWDHEKYSFEVERCNKIFKRTFDRCILIEL